MASIPLPRVRIAHLPTPIEDLPRVSRHLGGPALWAKRDDLTGLAFGGNKVRKLEYFLAQAQAQGADTIITRGALQSNHCRQTAAAAARVGLDCVLVLSGTRPKHISANLQLDLLLGAEIVWTDANEAESTLQAAFDDLQSQARKPYLIPLGGTNPLGVYAFSVAMQEFLGQGVQVDRIVVASASGGTQAGLILGARLHGFEGNITGISTHSSAHKLQNTIMDLIHETSQELSMGAHVSREDVEVIDGYQLHASPAAARGAKHAIETFARFEGLLLDPTYTSIAANGMMDLIHLGVIHADERVLFWHTGGAPALFADSGG